MVIRKRTFQELSSQSLDYLVTNTDITMLSPGGVARSIVDVTNHQLSEFYDTLDTDITMAYLSTAQGFFLDLIGRLFNVGRNQSSAVEVFRDDKVVKFYATDPGVALSKLLPDNKIPVGTKITSASGNISYTVTRDEYFSPTDAQVFVTVRSDGVGTSANVGANTLTTHTLSPTTLGVTNVSPISSGVAIEEDESYRAKISATATAAETSNETAIRLAVLSAPGVANIHFMPFVRGSGTFDLMVIPEGNRVPVQTKRHLEAKLSSSSAFGISYKVREPDYVPIQIEVQVKFRNDALDGQKNFLFNDAESSLLNYIGDIRPGEEFIVSRAVSNVLDVSPEILDAEVVYLCINGRAQIIRNYQLEDDEVFLPSEHAINPIVVRT